MKRPTGRQPRERSDPAAVGVAPAGESSPVHGLLLYAPAIFLSAFLLFQVQPLMARYILPWFGGSAGVWTVCVLFFQVFLLVGYAYAHLSIRLLRPKWQAALHLAIVAAAVLMLPIAPSEHWQPAADQDPTARILLLLLVSLGGPYFLLSSTAPLLQAWFSRINPGRSPYRLYALSNLASLLALLSYPFVVEPALGRAAQVWIWSGAFVVLALLLAVCAIVLWLKHPPDSPAVPDEQANPEAKADSAAPLNRQAMWLLLPACGSLLMLAFTARISQEVAVVPFLWVLPLALYLLSFIICFDSPRWYVRSAWGWALAAALAAGVAIMLQPDLHILLQILTFSAALFICCMVCHGELYRLRPDPKHLTAFYLMVAAGGAIGGFLVGIAAPLLLDGHYELHGGLLGTVLLLMAAMYMDPQCRMYAGRLRGAWYGAIAGLVVLGMLLWLDAGQRPEGTNVIEQRRNFYGVLTVYEMRDRPVRSLYHGGIMHGIQRKEPLRQREPTAYYGEQSGVGVVLRLADPDAPPRRIGAVGLGVGTIATYGRPQDLIRFYEIDIDVEQLARAFFTYLDDTESAIEMVPGDARLSLEREPDQGYDVLVVDAFSGAAVPAHLLTVEAIELYIRHLKEDGILAIHVSNQHLDLLSLAASLAEAAGLHGVAVVHDPTDRQPLEHESAWALMSRRPEPLQREPIRAAAEPLQDVRGVRPWSDDYSSLFQVMK